MLALTAALGALLAVGVVRLLHLHPRDLTSLAARRRALQTEALRGFLARVNGQSILPPNAVTIAVRADLLQGVLAASLPYRQTFENGKYVARLDSARVDLTDGLALVQLTGEGSLASDSTISAKLQVDGWLGIARIDRASGQLVPRLLITDVRVIRAGPAALRAVTNPAVRFFSRAKAREWNDLDAPVRLPLRLESVLKLPRVDGDISIPESSLPLTVRLAAVTTLRDLLVVSLDLMPDSASASAGAAAPSLPGGEGAEAAQARAGPPLDDAAFSRLHEAVHAAADRDTLWRAIQNAGRDVVIVLPRHALADLAGRAGRRLRSGATVDFRPEIAESLDKDIAVKVLGQKLGAGHVHVDIRVRHLRGRLETAGAVGVGFLPPDAFAIDLPIRIAEGQGDAAFHARWDPAALVSVVCKGFETRLDLAGAILSTTQSVRGSVRFGLEGGRIVGRPRIQRDRIRIAFDLDARSWAKVRHALAEQDRFGRCSVGLDPDALVAKLHALARKGVNVRLPADLVPSFALPVVFEDAYDQGAVRVAVLAYSPDVLVRRDYVRFALNADLRVIRRKVP